MSTYAIGDIQGCHQALMRLLDRLDFDPAKDRLWFCGDLVNRGGESLQVLREVYQLRDRSVVVLGNHDLHMLAEHEGLGKKNGSNAEFRAVFDAPDGLELLTWLRKCPMAHADKGFLMVHAGLPPQWDTKTTLACAAEVEAVLRGPEYRQFFERMYANKPDRWRPGLKGISRLRFITNALTRMRFVDGRGALSYKDTGPPGSQGKGLLPWFKSPLRTAIQETIVFGHWSALGWYNAGGVIALDTGCVWGRTLTAIKLKRPNKPIQVPGLNSR